MHIEIVWEWSGRLPKVFLQTVVEQVSEHWTKCILRECSVNCRSERGSSMESQAKFEHDHTNKKVTIFTE